jgi:hypothetical protein
LRIPLPDAASRVAGLNSPGRTLRVHPFTSMRFHVLLNSPFKVLFNFPSRYLSAIGLVPVFSLRWSLPPIFGLHSQATRLRGSSKGRRPPRLTGLTPSLGKATIRRTWTLVAAPIGFLYTTFPDGRWTVGFGAGLFPLHSPLLRESLLVSFPPLTDMLKFSG